MLNAGPSHPRCHISSIPPELISEILKFACDNAGDTVYLKWRFPSIANRVSKRFYRVTMDTHALWRYIYVSEAPYHFNHIRARISRPPTILLIADVLCSANWSTGDEDDTDNAGENWRELLEIVVPLLGRVSTLIYRSPENIAPINALLRHTMPMLEILYIEGTMDEDGGLPVYNLSPTQFPALRTLRSSEFLHWENEVKLPDTIEELYLDMDREGDILPSEGFWDFLPPNLRALKVEHLSWYEIPPPRDGKPRLPFLTELGFVECHSTHTLGIIRHMEGSRLKTLSISVMDAMGDEMRDLPFDLELPALTHFTWGSRSELPSMARFLRQCPALVSVRLNTFKPLESVSEFVGSLASDPMILPCLEDLKALGTSIFSLRKVVQARPNFKRLEVHVSELGLRPLATREDFRIWEECVDWLDSHFELVGNRVGCPGVSFNDTGFYKDNLPRYRSWEDMMAGRAVDMPDWKGIEEVDREFWMK